MENIHKVLLIEMGQLSWVGQVLASRCGRSSALARRDPVKARAFYRDVLLPVSMPTLITFTGNYSRM